LTRRIVVLSGIAVLLLGAGCSNQDFSGSGTAPEGPLAKSAGATTPKPGKFKVQTRTGHLTPIPVGTPAGLIVPSAN